MKRISAFAIACAMILSLSACGGGASSTASSAPAVSSTASSEAASSDTSSTGILSALLPDVTIVYPADMVGEDATQEQLDQEVAESNGDIKSATLNDDGTATYVMDGAYHKQMLQDFADSINGELEAMVGSEDYPNFTAIEANDDFTSFTVTTKSTTLDLNEAFSVMGFYFYGGMYGVLSGDEAENIHVDFVNADTGEIIESSDSSESSSEG